MKTCFLKKVTNILIFGFLASPSVYAGSEPRNGPDLSGTSIPLKFDRAISEKTLIKINTMCLKKNIIYPLLQKISINSNEALVIHEGDWIETSDISLLTKTYAVNVNNTIKIESTTSSFDTILNSKILPQLLLNINGYNYKLVSFRFNSGTDSQAYQIENKPFIAQSITFELSPEDFQGPNVSKTLILKLPVVKYEIAYSETEDEFGDRIQVPRIKNFRIEGDSSETHPLYNNSTNKAVSFTLNTKEYVSCIKNGIAGEK